MDRQKKETLGRQQCFTAAFTIPDFLLLPLQRAKDLVNVFSSLRDLQISHSRERG